MTSLVFVVVIVQKQRRDEEEAKRKEIEALQSQLKQLQEMAAQQQKGGVSTTAAAKSDRVAGKKAKPKERPPPPPPETNDDDTNTLYQIDRCVFMMQIFLSNHFTHYMYCVDQVFDVLRRTCIFCGEKNEAFTEEGLDLHYWKSCPMLKRCSFCKQVASMLRSRSVASL